MELLAIFLVKLLNPIGFIIAIVIVLQSKKIWIIVLSAVISALAVETILYSNQAARTWGQELPIGLLAGLAHASIVFTIRSRLSIQEKQSEGTSGEATTAGESQDQGDNPIEAVAAHLKNMGYDLTPYGAVVALLELKSGYSAVETASHISITTMALDVKKSGTDIGKLMRFMPHAMSLLEVLKYYKDNGMINPTQWQNDANAIMRISTIDEHQAEWVEKVLSDPIAGKERLARSRVA